MNQDAVKELLYKMADDALIIGHRNSEWTGLGPVIEEDIAFSSMAQDKIGHAQALYNLLHVFFGEDHPDKLGFLREEGQFKCCQLVEYPIGEYDFSLMRHFLFDNAELIRYTMLTESSFEPLAQLARKMRGEIKYHTLHADTWVDQLAQGTEESKARMQSALNECWPLALGVFEEGEFEEQNKTDGIFPGEAVLKEEWLQLVTERLKAAELTIPEDAEAAMGGRKGYHTGYLKPMLDEMTEVVRLDPQAEW